MEFIMKMERENVTLKPQKVSEEKGEDTMQLRANLLIPVMEMSAAELQQIVNFIMNIDLEQ